MRFVFITLKGRILNHIELNLVKILLTMSAPSLEHSIERKNIAKLYRKF